MEYFCKATLYQVLGLYLLSMITIGSANSVHFDSCGTNGTKVVSVDIKPAECFFGRCTLKHHVKYTIDITFKSKVNSTTATNLVSVLAIGSEFIYPIPEDACHNVVCPITANQTKHVIESFHISTRIPMMDLKYKWILKGDKKRELFCIIMPFHIGI